MSDTAQPGRPAADGRGASDALALAAQAFKQAVGAAEGSGIPDQVRDDGEGLDPGLRRDDEDQDEGSEIPGSRPAPGQAAGDDDEAEQAGDEPQPDEVPLPASWPAEQAELWESLPPEARAFIALREGQRDAAVNAKFQEAANLRKAHEAEIEEAKLNRQRYAQAVDDVLGLVVPTMPPRTMLDRRSPDYDPDAYHYRKALHEDTVAFLNRHRTQRQQIAAQEDVARFNTLNDATRDGLIAAVPDIADHAKAPALFQELIDYAVSLGTPADTFESPTAAIEWHVLWKAREYDRLQSARARVKDAPRPEPRKAQPAVRPGVATRREAAEQQRRGAALERLRKEGSVDAGAAAFKHLLKGNLS
jgi:hypothetical protein